MRVILAGIFAIVMAGCNVLMAGFSGLFVGASTVKDVSEIALIKTLMSNGVLPKDFSIPAEELIIWVAVGVFIVTIPRVIAMFFNNYLIASVMNRLATDIRYDMYAHIHSLPFRFFHKSRIGDLISRMNNDIGLIMGAGNMIMLAIEGPIMILLGIGRMFMICPLLALMTVFVVPLMAMCIGKLSKKIRSFTIVSQSKLADVSATLEESMRGVRIIKGFGMEKHEIDRFDRVNKKSLDAILYTAKRAAMVSPITEMVGSLAIMFLMLVGGILIIKKILTFDVFVEFLTLSFMVSSAFRQIARLNVQYQQTMAGADRIFELLDIKSDMSNKEDAVVLKDINGAVEFKNVSFSYNDGEKVISDMSFSIRPGEILAIVGASGAGKSTIADLLARFYDVDSGSITVDGFDVRDVTMESLREYMAIVPQETILFSGTIAENISYSKPDATMDEIIASAKDANAHDFISEFPSGYETVLGEGGVGLSGGQRQRLAIARALLRNPRILILDEATSALDAASEGVVQEALDRLMKGRTTVVIAHRLSTATGADRILVMDKGEVIEEGSFDKLLNMGGSFSQLYKTQFKLQE